MKSTFWRFSILVIKQCHLRRDQPGCCWVCFYPIEGTVQGCLPSAQFDVHVWLYWFEGNVCHRKAIGHGISSDGCWRNQGSYPWETTVDIQKDADFEYMRGSESLYMYQIAFDLYAINTQRMMRYARRRGIAQEIKELIKQAKEEWLAKNVSLQVGLNRNPRNCNITTRTSSRKLSVPFHCWTSNFLYTKCITKMVVKNNCQNPLWIREKRLSLHTF